MIRVKRTLKFHKALINFPTGMDTMKIAGEAVEQRTVDTTAKKTMAPIHDWV